MKRDVLHSAANGNESGEQKLDRVNIADIVFSYNNSDLILALRKRGGFIAAQKFDKMREQDAVVNELFNQYERLTVPVSAFITFESDNGKLCALKNRSTKVVLGQPLKFIDASEPTDIIWENRHLTSWDYTKNQTIAAVIIFVLLLGSFIIVFLVAQFSSKVSSTYP